MTKTGNKKIWKQAVRLILFLCIGLMIGYQCCLLYAGRDGRPRMPMPFGYGQAVVMSGSMSPAFEVGDLLIYHAQKEYRVGDMVAFCDAQQDLVTHRIIEKNRDFLITKGDANSVADAPVPYSDVYGKVILVVPKVGSLILFLQHPTAILLVLVLLTGGLAWNHRQERKSARAQLEQLRAQLADDLQDEEGTNG